MDLKAKLDRAVAHEGQGEHDAAIALLDEIIAADPRFPQAHYTRGNNWFFQRQLDKAVADYERAAELEPANVSCWYNLGVALLHFGDGAQGITMVMTDGTRKTSGPQDGIYLRSIAAFTKALALDDTHNRALVMRGYVHRNRQDLESARADFRDAATRLNDAVGARELQALEQRA